MLIGYPAQYLVISILCVDVPASRQVWLAECHSIDENEDVVPSGSFSHIPEWVHTANRAHFIFGSFRDRESHGLSAILTSELGEETAKGQLQEYCKCCIRTQIIDYMGENRIASVRAYSIPLKTSKSIGLCQEMCGARAEQPDRPICLLSRVLLKRDGDIVGVRYDGKNFSLDEYMRSARSDQNSLTLIEAARSQEEKLTSPDKKKSKLVPVSERCPCAAWEGTCRRCSPRLS